MQVVYVTLFWTHIFFIDLYSTKPVSHFLWQDLIEFEFFFTGLTPSLQTIQLKVSLPWNHELTASLNLAMTVFSGHILIAADAPQPTNPLTFVFTYLISMWTGRSLLSVLQQNSERKNFQNSAEHYCKWKVTESFVMLTEQFFSLLLKSFTLNLNMQRSAKTVECKRLRLLLGPQDSHCTPVGRLTAMARLKS